MGLALVVLKAEARLTAGEVLAFLRDRLARYKVPKKVEFVESLPLSRKA